MCRRQAELVLERKVSELESKKSSEELVHGEMARFLRDQKVSLSRDVDAWNARFKEDLDRKEDELKVGWVAIVASCSAARNDGCMYRGDQQLKEDRKVALDRLNELQDRYDRDLATEAKAEVCSHVLGDVPVRRE